MSKPKLAQPQIIDWQNLISQLRDEKVAVHIVKQLLAYLPEAMQAIHTATEEKSLKELLMHVHKLHGACSYCRVPGMTKAAKALEHVLHKHQWFAIDTLLATLEQQVELFLQVASEDSRLNRSSENSDKKQ